MILSYRSSVNRWECDENDHLNVRFYVDKHMQAVTHAIAAALGGDATRQLNASVRSQHIRFLAESRLASPLSGYVGLLVGGDDGDVGILSELRHSASDQVLSSCVTRIADASMTAALRRCGMDVEACPTHAGPRGVPDSDHVFCDQTSRRAPRSGVHADRVGCGTAERVWHGR